MKKNSNNTFTSSLLLLFVAFVALIITRATGLAAPWDLVIPGVIAGLSLLLMISGNKTVKAPTPEAPADTPAPKAKPKTSNSSSGDGRYVLYGLIFWACAGALIYWLVWDNGFKKIEYFINPPEDRVQTTVTGMIPSSHKFTLVEQDKYLGWIKPGKVYSTSIILEKGYTWRWYFDHDISYRVKKTGKEPFTLVRTKMSGKYFTADWSGVLQIKTTHPWVRVEAISFKKVYN